MRARPWLLLVLLAVGPACGRDEPPPSEAWPLRVGDAAVLGYGAQTGEDGRLAPVVGEHLGWRPDGLAESGWVLLILLDPAVYDALGALVIPLAEAAAFEGSLATTSRARRGDDGWRLTLEPGTWLDLMTRAQQVVRASSGGSTMDVLRAVREGVLGSGGRAALELDVVLDDDRVLVVPSFEARAVCRRVADSVLGLHERPRDARGVWSLAPHAIWLAFADVLAGLSRDAGVAEQLLDRLGRGRGGFDAEMIAAGRLLAEADLWGLDALQSRLGADRWDGVLVAREGSSWRRLVSALEPVPDVPRARFSLHVDAARIDASTSSLLELLETVASGSEQVASRLGGLDRLAPGLAGWGGLAVLTQDGTLTVDVASDAFDPAVVLEAAREPVNGVLADHGRAAIVRTVTAPDGRVLGVDGDGGVALTAAREDGLAWFALGELDEAPRAVASVREALSAGPAPDAPVALYDTGVGEPVLVAHADGPRVTWRLRLDR